jgi:exopolysaccharide biosynthesis protein
LLVGLGRASDWIRVHVAAGAQALVTLATRPDWRSSQLAIGGGPLLVDRGRVVHDPTSPIPHERNVRHPVLGVGILLDRRTLIFVGVDGRQRASVGLTQPELAAYLQWLGAAQAMAFDSGGSVTMVVRFPEHSAPTVVNSPSDGHERPVGDALLVFEVPARTRVAR